MLNSENKVKLVRSLIAQIKYFLETKTTTIEQKEIFELISLIQLDENNINNQKPKKPQKKEAILNALNSIKDSNLMQIREYILLALNHLQWNVDAEEFYGKTSGIGKDYLTGNMNTELIGPKTGFFVSNQLRLGLFLLEPNIFYKDHMHAAPELYLNLTGGTQWRFEHTNWTEKSPDSIIYNPPFRTHAMKVGDIPFLSVWCWTHSFNSKCILVPR